MHEKDKLDEAQHFLDRMSTSQDPKCFRFELSAFLAATRSVLQYAFEEVKSKPAALDWYKAQVTAKPVIRFLKDKRDVSIHRHPVVPTTLANVHVRDHLSLSESLHLRVINAEGQVVQETFKKADPPPPRPPQPPVVTYVYSFVDWPGSEDVVALARLYLAEVRWLVADGMTQGHLTK